MKNQSQAKHLRLIIGEIEKSLRRLGANGRVSAAVKEDIHLCRESCRTAKEHLKKGDIENAFLRILDAKTRQHSALRTVKQIERLYERIKADLEATLPEVRRQVVERRYPRFARIIKQEAGRW
jgi:hypothetical protein